VIPTFGGKLCAGDVFELRPVKVAGRVPDPHDSAFADVRFVVVERTGNDASYAAWVRHPPRRESGAPATRTRPLTGGHHDYHYPYPGQALAAAATRRGRSWPSSAS
jgi:hypothetical protein